MKLRRKWVGTLLAVCAAVLSSPGCVGSWEAYQQIELGKPLPSGHLLLRKGVAKGRDRVWRGGGVWPLPASWTRDSVAVTHDDAGNVTGKFYDAFAFGHYLVVLGAADRRVREFQVPASAFREPDLDRRKARVPPEWRYELRRLQESLVPLAKEASGDSRDQIIYSPTYGSLAETEPGHSFAIPISEKRLAEHIRRKLAAPPHEVPVTLGKDVDLSGLPDAKAIAEARVKASVYRDGGKATRLRISAIFLPWREQDILDYLRARTFPTYPDTGDEEHPPPGLTWAGGLFLLISWCHGGKYVSLLTLSERPAALLGITREGFDWQYTNPNGGTIRIQNLGGRRIRIEAKGLTLADPLLLVPILTFASDDDHLHKAVLAKLTRAIRADPNNLEAYLGRGATYAQAGHWDKALADLEQAETLDPDNVKVRRAHKAAKREADAYYKIIAHFRRSLSWARKNTDVFTFLERTYRWSDGDRGIRDFTRAIQLHADSATAYLNRGVAYYLRGRYAQAEADFSKAIEMNPKDPDAYCYRAYTRARRGRWKAARTDVEACHAAGGAVEKAFLERLQGS